MRALWVLAAAILVANAALAADQKSSEPASAAAPGQNDDTSDFDSQFELARRLANGDGAAKDRAKALEIFLKLANKTGDAVAQFNTAVLLSSKTNPDPAQAFDWFRKSAQQGYASAQERLGEAYLYGEGTTANAAEAAKWFQMAADQGDAGAQYQLALQLANGTGIKQDIVQAANWYQKAADQGDASAQNNLGTMYKYGNGVEKDLSKALELYRKSAQRGNKYGQYNLALQLKLGEGATKDVAQAAGWYKKAADQGYALAQYGLGELYADGTGFRKDDAQAFAWFKKSAEQGYAYGQFRVALAYAKGTGVPQALPQAAAWYRKAADQGDMDSQNNLAAMYERGEGGLLQDFVEAYKLYLACAQQGDAWCQRNLARLLWEGNGVQQNAIQAHAWMNLAAANVYPHPNAQKERDQFSEEMSKEQIAEGQRLAREWSLGKPLGNSKLKNVMPKKVATSDDTSTKTGANDGWPARPGKRPGVTSCNTQCFNGDCKRTYDDGRHVRFQARQKWNPFNNQMEWDSGGC